MSFARQSLWSLLALAFGVVASVALPRLLGAEARGEYAIVVKIAGLVLAAAQFGIPEVLLQLVAENRNKRQLVGTALAVGILGSILFSIALGLAVPWLAGSVLKGVSPSLLFISLVGSVLSIQALMARRFIQLAGNLGVYNLLDVVRTAMFLGVALVAGLLVPREAWDATLAWFVGELFLWVASLLFVLRHIAPAPRINPRLGAEMIVAGLPIQIGIVAMFVGNESGAFLLNARLDLTAVGLYAVALSIARLVLQIAMALRTALQPRLTGPEEASAQVTARVTRHGLLWMLLLSLVLLAGVPLVPFVFGREFSDAEPVLALALPGMVAYGVWQLLAGHLLRLGRRLLLGGVACVFALASVGFQLVGVQVAGLPGAALGLTAAYILAAAIICVSFRSAARLPTRALIPSLADLQFYVLLARRVLSSMRRPAAGAAVS